MGYRELSGQELQSKAEQALKLLDQCAVCPRYCGVNRAAGEKGKCRGGRNAVISSWGPHFGEESVLVGRTGSGTVFFTHCNLGCVFCQNYDISQLDEGSETTPGQLADIMLELQDSGCHNLNLVSPSHYVPQILESLALARVDGLKIPLVWNSGGYDAKEALDLLDGVVDIYMPDLKFGDDTAAAVYTGVKDYFTVAGAAVKEMHRQVGDLKTDQNGLAYQGLMVRHLVMPDNLARSDKIFKFIAEEVSRNTYINIMDQYYPAHKARQFPELARRITRREYQSAISIASEYGLTRLA